jgi:hypothetical protein
MKEMKNEKKIICAILLLLVSFFFRESKAQLSVGDTLKFPSGSLAIKKPIRIDKKCVVYGSGTTIISHSDSVVFYVTANEVEFIGINFVDSSNIAGAGAIFFDRAGMFKVIDCSFEGFANYGIKFSLTNDENFLGGLIQNCHFKKNGIGIFSGNRGEYVLVSSCNLINNNVGLYMLGGNNIIQSCNINYNNTGIEIAAGKNNAHGIINACNINHNKQYALRLSDYEIGQTISNTHIFFGDLEIKNTGSTKFNNCTLALASYHFNNNVNLQFIDSTIITDSYFKQIVSDDAYKLVTCTDLVGNEVHRIKPHKARH